MFRDPAPAVETRLTGTSAPGAVVLIRLYVGDVFLPEGVPKFLRPDQLGTGRFDKASTLPSPASAGAAVRG
ncbi:hypothetical protein [Streptomyces sp. ALB3]|uniref:hypothetical protein n=1 Tax=Streptomyces sp. ALB3 TaxID=3374278 RepID=UPI00379B0B94